jgi:beta-lactamase superfamily II metal-dependent hydrolase
MASEVGIQLHDLTLLQVPHHGSRRNLCPAILNNSRAELAVTSAGVDGAPKHPSAKVTNALIRRGATVFATQGTNLVYRYNALPRRGCHNVSPLDFTEYVDT